MYLDATVVGYDKNKNIATLVQDCDTKKCEGCKGGLFCKQKNLTFDAISETELKEGDRVKVYLEPRKTVFSVVVLFGVPLLVMFVFILLGHYGIIGETLCYVLTLLSLVVSFGILFFLNRRFSRKFTPVIKEIHG